MKYLIFIVILVSSFYLLLWFSSFKRYPIEYGVSFNQNHAMSLGLDWRTVYTAMLDDLKPPYIRIAAMWSAVEPEPGTYDFRDVDWMMDEAAKRKVQVLLVVGQKAPRWPECHVPPWIENYDDQTVAREHLMRYIETAVNHYKNHTALEFWQVENEPFITFRFGECQNYHPELVADEIALVRAADSAHPILVTDSGELSTWRRSIRAGDYFGTTIYRVVRLPKGSIVTYDWLPPALYRWKARIWGRRMDTVFISELQAEPWFTQTSVQETPIETQEETMNVERLKKHLAYARRVGSPRAYLWGVEWWYWMKEKQGDSRYWDTIKDLHKDQRE